MATKKPVPVVAIKDAKFDPPRQPQHQRPGGPGAQPNSESQKRQPTSRT